MFPRSRVRQIEGIAFYHAMLDVPLSKLGMELKRRRTLSNTGPTSDKEHFTSHVHLLSMVQNPLASAAANSIGTTGVTRLRILYRTHYVSLII